MMTRRDMIKLGMSSAVLAFLPEDTRTPLLKPAKSNPATLSDFMRENVPVGREARIFVVGPTKSGKTLVINTLIDHVYEWAHVIYTPAPGAGFQLAGLRRLQSCNSFNVQWGPIGNCGSTLDEALNNTSRLAIVQPVFVELAIPPVTHDCTVIDDKVFWKADVLIFTQRVVTDKIMLQASVLKNRWGQTGIFNVEPHSV